MNRPKKAASRNSCQEFTKENIMTFSSRIASLTLLVALAVAPAAIAGESYEPSVGQPGKDVVWVPTSQALVEKMLDMAKVTPKDYVIDLGSGDGRTVITAAKRGSKAHGIEYNPDMVELAQKRAKEAGVADKATFAKADLFESDFSQAQVITMFLLPSINEKLRPKILDLKPGTRIVSNSFRMGDWQPDQTENVTDCQSYCTALLWIVPAKVDGAWRLGNQDLTLKQEFQNLSGTLGTTPITNAKMDGANIVFTAGTTKYSGTVDGKTMKGNNWTATKM
jgi:SAM-dependent methyltransferase